MPPKQRKIPDHTVNDANELLLTLNDIQAALGKDVEDLSSGLIPGSDEFRRSLQAANVCMESTAQIYNKDSLLMIKGTLNMIPSQHRIRPSIPGSGEEGFD